VTVRYRDGVEIELSDGTRVVCDADDPDGDVTVVSHAHGDHLPAGEATAVCSPLTAALGTARRENPLHRTTDDRVALLPAGHVAGSRAALITDPDGTRYCYTGDVCTRSRLYLDGFEPPDADVLIVESTYGEPGYEFPPHETVAADIGEWLGETAAPVLLFGYALGRAQKLQLLADRAGRTVYTTDAVVRVNEAIEAHRDVSFPARGYGDDVDLSAGDALVLPMTTARIDWIDDLAERIDRRTEAAEASRERVEELTERVESREKRRRRERELQTDVRELRERRSDLERRLDDARERDDELGERIDDLRERIESDAEQVTDIESDLKYAKTRLDDAKSELESSESKAEELESLRSQRQSLTEEITRLRRRKQEIKKETRDAFDDAIRDVVTLFETGFESARLTSEFELVVARDGREASLDALSEGEVELLGLATALAGYEAFDVAERVPVMLVDRLGGIADENLGRLTDYLSGTATYLVMTAYPEHSAVEGHDIDPADWSVVSDSTAPREAE